MFTPCIIPSHWVWVWLCHIMKKGFCRHNQSSKYFNSDLIKWLLSGWTWLNQVMSLKMKRFKAWVGFSCWSWRCKVPFCREDHTLENWVASRNWEQLLAKGRQEEWEPQSYNWKELNSAKSHVILKEYPELKEQSLANTSMSALLTLSRRSNHIMPRPLTSRTLR